ncbi:MAG: ferric reductase-like transmembrane domain-containing protein [Kofleriaceae bacterium]
MPTSEVDTAPAGPFIDAKFAKRLVLLNGLVPALVLVWDAYRGQLGVNEVNYAIRTTGLVGLIFLTLSLAITPLRRLTGWSMLIAVRRNLGLYGFFYILVHFVIFFVFDRGLSITSTLDEIYERVYLWFGFGALVMMIPLAVTSTDAMLSRLGAKRWKLLHRLNYPIVIAGVLHFYLLVKADVTRPVAFAVIVGALLGYRAVGHYVDLRSELAKAKARRPASPGAKKKFWSGELVVSRIFEETPDVKTFRFTLPDGGPLPFEHVAGQYLNVALPINGKRVNRSYTIASSPTRGSYCEISVKRAPDGYASHHLHDTVREGDKLKISAPAGKFYFAGHESERVVLVAGGVGITPMMSIVRSLTDRCWTGDIYLIFSVKKRSDIVFEHELQQLERRFPNLHVLISLSADPEATWEGERGHITQVLIEKHVPDLKRGPVLLCGPDPMMTAMRKIFVELGVPDAQVLQEAFISPVGTDDAATAAAPVEAGEGAVTFQRGGATIDVPGLTLLEAAEECGVAIPFECRSGICGQCKTKLVAGRVTMEVQDALTPADKARGLVLACQARPVRDVIVDA